MYLKWLSSKALMSGLSLVGLLASV